MEHHIVEKPAFEVVGWTLRTTTIGAKNLKEIPLFWESCNREGKVKLLEPMAGSFGLLGLCGEWDSKNEEFTYIIGVESSRGAGFPEGTRSLAVRASKYAVFGCVGVMPDAVQTGWATVFGKWFPSSGYEHSGGSDFERYPPFPLTDPRGDPSSNEYFCEIWVPVKNKV